jgi:hypothetical protein
LLIFRHLLQSKTSYKTVRSFNHNSTNNLGNQGTTLHQAPKQSQKTSTSICTQIQLAGAKLFHADGWPDTTKLTVILH